MMWKKNIKITGTEDRNDCWEEEEEAIMNEIRQKSEELEIPEGLLPENMMKKIKQDSQEKSRSRQNGHRKNTGSKYRLLKQTAAVVTAAAVCMVTIYQLANYKGSVTLTGKKDSGEYTETAVEYGKLEHGMVQAESREEIYEKIQKNRSEYEIFYDTLDESEGTANEIMNSGQELKEETNPQTSGEQGNYYKDTNEQVEGVSEGDTIKTDGKYIYIAKSDNSIIKIVEADNGKVTDVSDIEYESEIRKNVKEDLGFQEQDFDDVRIVSKEMYVNEERLTLILSAIAESEKMYGDEGDIEYQENYYYRYNGYNMTYILSYDISDRSNPELLAKHSQQGALETSRVAEGYLYVISEYGYDMDMEERFMPYLDGTEVPVESVYVNEDGGSRYTIITALEVAHPEKVLTNLNILTDTGVVYVSQKNIYIAVPSYSESNTKQDEEEWVESYSWDTVINKFQYEAGEVSLSASSKIVGEISEQFYMDEFNGVLRVVASVTSRTRWTRLLDESFAESVIGKGYKNFSDAGYQELLQEVQKIYGKNTSLVYNNNKWYVKNREVLEENRVYTLDEQLNILGRIEGVAKGEDLYSARFMGNTGYFVTFETVDPLFAVDFSDAANPKIISELKVPGFSTYLHFWEENKLLGIGYETEESAGGVRTVGYKLSMFDISDPTNVTEEDTRSERDCYSNNTWDYKSILVSKEKNVIGLKTWSSDNGYPSYVIYSYDTEQGFTEVFRYDSEKEYMGELRGIIINDVLYLILEDEGINTYDISQDYRQISAITY